ncbi:MAG: exonuclease domain-containing protein [Eubacterium sp.]|nr:exonuclease domain-containing protein [Eubacterium sp.]
MNYIVFDLEWNQSPYGKAREIERLPFEIIEIGAVKLNAEREIVDTFQVIIRPSAYKRLNYRTREIVHLDQKDLDNGEWFPDAVRRFLAWAGGDSIFCTWGTVDLPELQRNMNYYNLLYLLKGPMHYYDVQKLFAVQFEDMKSRRSLEYGADYLHLEKAREFHRALADAMYTAEIFQQIDMDVILAYDSIDVYQNPRTKTEEIHLIYNGYSKFISREFKTKEEAMQDPEVLATPCCLCGRTARKRIRWFSVNARNYYCVAECPEHGLEKGKIRMRRNDEEGIYVVKTVKVSSEAEMESIREKRKDLREKRRRRRHA